LFFATAAEALDIAVWLGRTGAASLGSAPLLQGTDFNIRPHALNWGCARSETASVETPAAAEVRFQVYD
jgi:hypothetical protein